MELCGSFYHTLLQLILASSFSDYGNIVAIKKPRPGEGKSADLYMRLTADERFYIEVKAPRALEWPNSITDDSKLRNVIAGCLSGLGGQISRNAPGALAIASSCVSADFVSSMKRAIDWTLRNRGRNRQSVAAICLVAPQRISMQPRMFLAQYTVDIIKNPHFFRPNPIRDSKSPVS